MTFPFVCFFVCFFLTSVDRCSSMASRLHRELSIVLRAY